MAERPQNKNLIGFDKMPEDRQRELASLGGKACQEARKQRKAAADLMKMFCELPLTDGRVKNRLKRAGIASEEQTNKMLMVVSIAKAAQAGNVYAFEKVLDLLGEGGMTAGGKENNLLEALKLVSSGSVNIDDLPELQQAAESDSDMVD